MPTDADFTLLRLVVLEESGNMLDPSRDHLFKSRLHKLLTVTGLESLDCLAASLGERPDSALRRAVAEAMTAKETSFFRDRSTFDMLQSELLPALIRRRESSRRLRLWSAACSSGQETYSLAMVLREHFPQVNDWQIEISGTDVSQEMIQRAQAGRYQSSEVSRGLPAHYRMKYLRLVGEEREDEEWEVVSEVKRMCRFYRRNLCDGPLPFEKYDGILLRNVMLYFPDELRRTLLLRVHRMLAPDGFLILGSSEHPGMPDHFQAELNGNAVYYSPLQTAGQAG